MKYFLTFVFCLNAFVSFGQQDKCTAIVDWQYNGVVNIYDKPNGGIIDQIKNDSAGEDFLIVFILDKKDNYFFVTLELQIHGIKKKGWIEKADYIGTYIRHEKYPVMDLVLYKFTNISDTDKIVIRSWQPELLTIERCDGIWTCVSVKQNGQTYTGWIKSVELCSNPYTTCN